MAKLASKFVKVVLSGAGGDELFAGYPWRYYRAAHQGNFDDYIDRYYKFWQRLVPNTIIKQLFKPIWPKVNHVLTRDIFKSVFNGHHDDFNTYEESINRSLYFEAKTFLHGLLVVEDKLSMAESLEMRVPLLDNDLVDFAMQIPVSYKLKGTENITLNENAVESKKNFYKRTHDGKYIFRKLMTRYVPAKIYEASKQGFSAPDASWFKGESIEFVKKLLLNPSSRIFEFLDFKTVSQLVGEHTSGKENRRLLIWSLLSFEICLQECFT